MLPPLPTAVIQRLGYTSEVAAAHEEVATSTEAADAGK